MESTRGFSQHKSLGMSYKEPLNFELDSDDNRYRSLSLLYKMPKDFVPTLKPTKNERSISPVHLEQKKESTKKKSIVNFNIIEESNEGEEEYLITTVEDNNHLKELDKLYNNSDNENEDADFNDDDAADPNSESSDASEKGDKMGPELIDLDENLNKMRRSMKKYRSRTLRMSKLKRDDNDIGKESERCRNFINDYQGLGTNKFIQQLKSGKVEIPSSNINARFMSMQQPKNCVRSILGFLAKESDV